MIGPRRTSVVRLLLAAEAVAALAVARLVVLLPFRSATAVLGRLEQAAVDRPTVPAGPDGGTATAAVSWAVPAAARRVPWRTTCLQEAVAAVLMLRRRAVTTETVVGVLRHTGRGPVAAHAWVETANGAVVVGRRGHRPFRPVAVYRQTPRNDPGRAP